MTWVAVVVDPFGTWNLAIAMGALFGGELVFIGVVVSVSRLNVWIMSWRRRRRCCILLLDLLLLFPPAISRLHPPVHERFIRLVLFEVFGGADRRAAGQVFSLVESGLSWSGSEAFELGHVNHVAVTVWIASEVDARDKFAHDFVGNVASRHAVPAFATKYSELG